MPEIICDDNGCFCWIRIGERYYDADDVEDLVRERNTLLEHFRSVLNDIENIHQRKCRECGNVAYHADDRTPYVLCRKCGSQDTRRLKIQIRDSVAGSS